MISFNVEGLQHHPVGSHDFPHYSQALVCRPCSYSGDGMPLAPIGWPCPPVRERQQATETQQQHCRQQQAAAVRLGRQVAARRVALGWTRKQLAERAGISTGTIGHVERANKVRPSDATLTALDWALQWRPGTARQLLDEATDEPAEVDVSMPAEVAVILRAGLPAGVERQLVAHVVARRQDLEAGLETEAHLLLAQARMLARRADGAGRSARHRNQ